MRCSESAKPLEASDDTTQGRGAWAYHTALTAAQLRRLCQEPLIDMYYSMQALLGPAPSCPVICACSANDHRPKAAHARAGRKLTRHSFRANISPSTHGNGINRRRRPKKTTSARSAADAAQTGPH